MPFASVSKRVLVHNLCYGNEFYCHANQLISITKVVHQGPVVQRTIRHRFLPFHFSIYFLVFVSIEKIYQTLETVFHSRQCFIGCPNTSNFVKNTPLCIVFSTPFSVFGNQMKHFLSCLIYYIKTLANNNRTL